MPQLAELHHCTGCTACAAACSKRCIAMEPDADGFLHPVVDSNKCINCGLCEKVCPMLNRTELEHTPIACAVRSRDETSRLASTSGGVFSELAREVLAHGGMVFGAAYDKNFRVIHICAENEAELNRIWGAKYAQSDLDGIFLEVKRRLDSGQQVLFSGTPCQVLGLKSFLKRDYENLLLVDLVCHSVPSPLAWEKYLEYISAENQLTAVNLRCKDTGWSHYGYSNRFEFSDGTSRMDRSGESLYMKLFGGGYITCTACTDCPAKGYARVSDLTLGDFWGIWDIAPEMDDDKGTSVVLIQSSKGSEIMNSLLENVMLLPVSLEEASRQNGAILRSSAANPKREEALELIRNGRIAECASWFNTPKPSLKQRIYRMANKLLNRS